MIVLLLYFMVNFVKVTTMEESSYQEVKTLRGFYDKELAHARRALDEQGRTKHPRTPEGCGTNRAPARHDTDARQKSY